MKLVADGSEVGTAEQYTDAGEERVTVEHKQVPQHLKATEHTDQNQLQKEEESDAMNVGEPLAGLGTSKDTSAFWREASLSVNSQEL